MRILITGGAGFIGSHLAENLLSDGHTVAIVDELNDYYDPALKRQNLEDIEGKGPVRFYEMDICDVRSVYELFEDFRPQAVVHLAARAGVRPSLEQPLLYERVNVFGTLVLLEACKKAGVKKFVFASSSSIYGVANQVPFREDDFANLPVSPYAATKLAGEKMTYTYSHLYGIRVICLRFFTVFGPRQRPDLAIRKFVDNISRGIPIQLFGDGTSGRDYTFVEDTVRGIVSALRYDCAWDVFNLGNSSPISLSEMVTSIEEVVGKKAIIERMPDQPGDVPITYADISKARAHLGYQPKTPFREGLARFVAWYRNQTAESRRALTAHQT